LGRGQGLEKIDRGRVLREQILEGVLMGGKGLVTGRERLSERWGGHKKFEDCRRWEETVKLVLMIKLNA